MQAVLDNVILCHSLLHRCGIGLDTWMFPVGDEVYSTGVNQPLLFINSFTFQWAKNITDMMKLVTLPDESGIQCHYT